MQSWIPVCPKIVQNPYKFQPSINMTPFKCNVKYEALFLWVKLQNMYKLITTDDCLCKENMLKNQIHL